MKISSVGWLGLGINLVSCVVVCAINAIVVAGDVAFPGKGKETRIACREFPGISYSVCVPVEYNPDKPCAILYTISPGGGGMVAAHQTANEVTPTIIVGLLGPRNGKHELDYMGELYAVMLDVSDRFNIDPTAQYCAGFSGGAVLSYNVARQYKERICGVMVSGGWLQKMYDSWYVYPRGLQVARVAGKLDAGGNAWAAKDLGHLTKAGCLVKDWSQPGGHAVGTPDIIKEMMQWLVDGKSDDLTRATAQAKAGKWAEAPYSDSSVREILDVLRTAPHTELGKLALHQLFTLMKDEGRFCKVLVPVSARGPELAGLFGYTAYGAALVNDAARFRSAVYAMNTVCPDKGGRWRGIIGALYLFSPGDAVVDSVAGQAFLEGCASAPDCHVFTKLVLAAAQLKNGQNAGVVAATINGVGGAGDPRLLRVIANLEKGLKEGGPALDARVWLDYFGEGD